MKHWRIQYTPNAENDLLHFIEQHPQIWNEIRRIMLFLAQEEDPRHPQNAELNVTRLEHDAPDWWRVTVGKPGPEWVRIVFLLQGLQGNREVELARLDKVEEFEPPKTILIMAANFRGQAYGKELRTRYKRFRDEN